ncbi:hypothetical protein IMZ48_13795 [Candidatus Bathyarchaeota archaeon]|nr:hypothetical protein [Candidatus Bathyarchaeota archaeon]
MGQLQRDHDLRCWPSHGHVLPRRLQELELPPSGEPVQRSCAYPCGRGEYEAEGPYQPALANTSVQDKKAIASNIESQARHCQALVIWTDCDLEGEHIGSEIRNAARKGNPRLEIKRARFSNIERA